MDVVVRLGIAAAVYVAAGEKEREVRENSAPSFMLAICSGRRVASMTNWRRGRAGGGRSEQCSSANAVKRAQRLLNTKFRCFFKS